MAECSFFKGACHWRKVPTFCQGPLVGLVQEKEKDPLVARTLSTGPPRKYTR